MKLILTKDEVTQAMIDGLVWQGILEKGSSYDTSLTLTRDHPFTILEAHIERSKVKENTAGVNPAS